MNFRDYMATDEDGNEFIFTVEMQRRLSQANLPVEPASLAQLDDIAPPPRRQSYNDRSQRDRSYDSRPQREYENDSPASDRSPQDEATFDTMFDIQIDPESGKYIGRVKWYNLKKGYGFIVRGGGEEIFFHKSGTGSDVLSTMRDGQWVLYDVEDTQKGPEATDVEPYDNPEE